MLYNFLIKKNPFLFLYLQRGKPLTNQDSNVICLNIYCFTIKIIYFKYKNRIFMTIILKLLTESLKYLFMYTIF